MLISLGNIDNEKISAFMQIENENNPLKNNFNKPIKESLKNSFIEETEIINEDSDILEDNNIDDFSNIFISQDNVSEYNINDDDELQELFKDK